MSAEVDYPSLALIASASKELSGVKRKAFQAECQRALDELNRLRQSHVRIIAARPRAESR